jgi:hypothetical protein
MLSLPDREAITAALNTPLPEAVRSILERITNNAEIGDYTYVAIIHATDSEQAIVDELGFSPLIHPIDGIRYDAADFEPYWAFLGDRGGWYELVHTIGNNGFAYVLIIEDAGDGELQAMCQR